MEIDLDGEEYEPRKAIKGRAVTDFILKFDSKEDLVAREFEEEAVKMDPWHNVVLNMV